MKLFVYVELNFWIAFFLQIIDELSMLEYIEEKVVIGKRSMGKIKPSISFEKVM